MSIGPWDFGGFDIAVLVLLLISGLMALGRGFMRELVSIVALIIGLFVALFCFGRFQNAAMDLIDPDWLANGTLGLGAFALSYMFVTFILRSGVKKLQGREPGFIDRLFGFGFGVARGLLIAALFVILLTLSTRNDETPNWIAESTFYPVLKPITTLMLNAPFAKLREQAEDTIELGRESGLENEPDSSDVGDAEQPQP